MMSPTMMAEMMPVIAIFTPVVGTDGIPDPLIPTHVHRPAPAIPGTNGTDVQEVGGGGVRGQTARQPVSGNVPPPPTTTVPVNRSPSTAPSTVRSIRIGSVIRAEK